MFDKDIMAECPGRVFWLTGLAGAGKTTVGKLLLERLKEEGGNVIYLDGDQLRQVWPNMGYCRESRFKVSMQNGRLCKLLSDQGFDVVCATISLFWKTQEWNRLNISNYFEIYLRVPMPILFERDQKGLYSKSEKGIVNNVYGVNIKIEEPKTPDLTIENYMPRTPELAVEKIIDLTALNRQN